jgi:hypothetical protein
MNFKMCGGLFSFCFLHETVFGNGQVAITHNNLYVNLCQDPKRGPLVEGFRHGGG